MGSFKNQRFALVALVTATLAGSSLVTRDAASDLCEHPATLDPSGKCVCPMGFAQKGVGCVHMQACPPGTKLVSGKCQSMCLEGLLIAGKCVDKTEKLPADAGKTVAIASGTFTAGASFDSALGRADPAHRVKLSAFAIDRYEVSVEQYEKCVKAGSCSKPLGPTQPGCNFTNAGRRAHPMNCVTWNEARSFCEWRGMRLPSEAEWEFAARGKSSLTYPWGDAAPTCANTAMTRANGDGKSCGGTTSAIGTHPEGKSPFGVHDLAGNVAEWTSDHFGLFRSEVTEMKDPAGPSNGIDRVVKGGSFDLSGSKIFAAARRSSAAPESRHSWLGFRCAKGPAPKPTPDYFVEVLEAPAPPVIEKPSTPMVSVPGGTFTMGRDGDPAASPAHPVTLSPYQLDTYEVTVADYLRCIDDKKCAVPAYDPKQSCNYDLPGHGLHPINCIKQRDAAAYCAWLGKRLPTEAEWEFAARGPKARTFPWGSGEPTCALATFTVPNGKSCASEGNAAVTTPIGQLPSGVGYFGNFDMAGNVAEFVADSFAPYNATAKTDPKAPSAGTERLLRGGSFKSGEVNAIARQMADEDWAGDTGGFRCAK